MVKLIMATGQNTAGMVIIHNRITFQIAISPDVIPKWAEEVKKTAPAGADLQSWRY